MTGDLICSQPTTPAARGKLLPAPYEAQGLDGNAVLKPWMGGDCNKAIGKFGRKEFVSKASVVGFPTRACQSCLWSKGSADAGMRVLHVESLLRMSVWWS